MKRGLLRFLPERAASQIALIVVGSLVLASFVTAAALLIVLPRELRRLPLFPYVSDLITIMRQVEAAPSAEARGVVVEAALASQPRLARLAPDAVSSAERTPWPNRALADAIRREIGAGVEVLMLEPDDGRRGPAAIGLRLPDGLGLRMNPPPMLAPPRAGAVLLFLITMLVSLASLIGLLSLWATRAVVAPLSRLAEAADRFDPDRGDRIAVAHGPVEVTRLSAALEAMAARIRHMIEGRTQMLAAVSHDLRTPITRLRLRVEEIEEPETRRAILADLALMERMVGGALSYLRDGRATGAMAATDIPALLQTICDDFADLGHDVVYRGPAHASAFCDADQITRALTNLIDNAVKFGGGALVELDVDDPARIAVRVLDEGPGIPEEERRNVVEPFYRVDVARTLREGGGFGLGLAIVQAIAQAHRGELTLRERSGGGLEACLSWPVRQAALSG